MLLMRGITLTTGNDSTHQDEIYQDAVMTNLLAMPIGKLTRH